MKSICYCVIIRYANSESDDVIVVPNLASVDNYISKFCDGLEIVNIDIEPGIYYVASK